MSNIANALKRGPVPVTSDWIDALEDQKMTVTICLRSGRKVTGTIEGQISAGGREATVFRIKRPKPPLAANEAASSQGASSPRPEGTCVLVSVKDIELIDIHDAK